jgi:hypothetical protein
MRAGAAMNVRILGMGLLFLAAEAACLGQSLPPTVGESLSGKQSAVADTIRGKKAVLVASFSRESGDGATIWMHALAADPVLAQVELRQLVMLGQAPGFVRGFIKSAMRKGMPQANQDRTFVLTADEKSWRAFFGVTGDKDAYVVVLDAGGNLLWRGHGREQDLEATVRQALLQAGQR